MVKDTKVLLELCPFCNGEVELWRSEEVVKCCFICKKCKVEVEFPKGIDSKDCIKRWNRRSKQSEIIKSPVPQSQSAVTETLSETICMDEGPNQFKTIKYLPTCPHGCVDCIFDPAYIKATYPSWYKDLYGEALPDAVHCENCLSGERYDDEDK